MHLWKKRSSNSLSSSSSSKSSVSSPNRRSRQPRLTRQRKLRHLTDLDVQGLNSPDKQASGSPVSASWTPPSSPPSHRDFSSSDRSPLARPLPLPLPEFSPGLRRDESELSSNSSNFGDHLLRSPREEASSAGLGFSVGDGLGAARRLSVGSTLDHGKKALQDPVEHIPRDFELIVPARCTPTSGFPSPPFSPQRLSTGDIFPSPRTSYQGRQVLSAPEFPASDTIPFASTSPTKLLTGPDSSEVYRSIGKTPGLRPKNYSESTSPLHSRTSPRRSSTWHGNSTVAVHPLPLPPGAAMPSQQTFIHQTASKSEVSSMKSQWQKGKLIGSGTFGNVYVATNRETGALCAMKEVNLIPDDPKSTESMQQLEQEIKVLSHLKHQNIVQYYGSEIIEDRFYIYLEYVYPGSISKYIRDHCGTMTESVVRNFTRHILSGLAYLHSKKTIHRDIKGANLLVDSSGVVKLADFGMAKHLSGRAAALSLKGSPYWMAPEVMQAMMQKDSGYDHAVDIWSLGCTIIEMFTGKPPWSEFEGAAAMFKVLRNESPPIPETLSAEGRDFLQCCFKRNPADRPPATKLLEHQFVNNSHHQEIHSCIQAISQMKLMDITKPPREPNIMMQMSIQDNKVKPSPNGETGQPYHGTSKSAAASRHSPRSTLEAIPSLSPPHSNHSTQNSSPSNAPNRIHPGAGNSQPCPLPCHYYGREYCIYCNMD